MNQLERAFWGFIFGDAFGVPVEFKKRDTFEVHDLQGFGTWNVPAGTWSDDSAMMFVTMDHLVCHTSHDELKKAFCDWAYRGFWTYNKEPSFDVGATIAEIIQRWEKISLAEQAKSDEFSNGNGALMRILPVSFATFGQAEEEIVQTITNYATMTHGHIRSTLSCIHYTFVVHNLLNESSLYDSLQDANQRFQKYLAKYPQEESSFIGVLTIDSLQREDIESTGYVLHTLEAVYWSLLNATSYYDTIHKAVHLGQDTDTIGAIAGALAGMYYPYLDVPTTWFSMIPRREEIQVLIQSFEQSLSYNNH